MYLHTKIIVTEMMVSFGSLDKNEYKNINMIHLGLNARKDQSTTEGRYTKPINLINEPLTKGLV